MRLLQNKDVNKDLRNNHYIFYRTNKKYISYWRVAW